MIIGSDFNSKAKSILKKLFELSNGKEGVWVKVDAIAKQVDLDKTEAKNLLEYLESKDCIMIETLGGPFLYGDISITKKGIVNSKK